MNWLITGGCGFLGTSLIQRLLQTGGHSIRVLDNLSVGTRDDLGLVCDFQEITANQAGQSRLNAARYGAIAGRRHSR